MASASGTGNSGGGRYFDWRSKSFDAFILLLVGLIGVGGAIGGSWYTGRSDDDRARQEFLRTERREVYAEFLAVTLSTWEKVDAVAKRPDYTAELPILADELTAVTALEEEIKIIGGGDASDSASELTTHVKRHANRQILGPYCRVAPPTAEVWMCDMTPSTYGSPDTETDDFRAERDDFVKLARDELNVE